MAWLVHLVRRLLSTVCHLLRPPPFRRRPPKHIAPPLIPLPAAAPSSPAKPHPPGRRLLSLPEDILVNIISRVTHTPHHTPVAAPLHVVDHRSYRDALPVSETCRALSAVFYKSLDKLCLSSPSVCDDTLPRVHARAHLVLTAIGLRTCKNLTAAPLAAFFADLPVLRSVDLSFVPAVEDDVVIALVAATAPRLNKLLLRKCSLLTDRALEHIARCHALHTLDLTYCRLVTDAGVARVAEGCGRSLRLLALAHVDNLTDQSLLDIAKHCGSLTQLCLRGLAHISNDGVAHLCKGIGCHVQGIDVTDCDCVTKEATIMTLKMYCPNIFARIVPSYFDKTLEQVLVSTLRHNIFIVHGSDPMTSRSTVHTVLIDNGDIVSASLLNSGTTDLSLLGIVLCKSYGSSLDEDAKEMLEEDYGIPTISMGT